MVTPPPSIGPDDTVPDAWPDTVPVLVDADWVLARQPSAGRADLVLADVRWYLDGRRGRDAYLAGHIAGARFIDLDDVLSAHGRPATDGRHPLPDPHDFALAMANAGIGDDTIVVAYDDSGGGTAGRLVWMLRAARRRAALLDGGLRAWPEPLESGEPTGERHDPAQFSTVAWPPELLATWDEVAGQHARDVATLLDARGADRYRGENEVVDRRAGHIPGAVNLPWSSLLDPATGRFRSPNELRARFADAGIDDEHDDVIASCGSGVSACAILVALEHAGLKPGRLFVPSWSGWSSDPDRAAAVGGQPGARP